MTNKTAVLTIILLVTFTLSLLALPLMTTGQTYINTKTTYAVIGVKPNPVGVGQEVLVWLGISDPLALETHSWEGLTVNVTDPNGTVTTLGTFRTDSTGSTGTVFIPDKVGTYKFQTHFPQQNYTWPPTAPRRPFTGNTLYLASDSEVAELVVQSDPIQYYPGIPMPTEYWTRPINSQFREWSPIAGNWVNIPPNFYAPYNDAPKTGHILWAKPLTTGGLVGGELGEHMFQTGDAYQGIFANSVIINGILYYNRFQLGFQGGIPSQGIVAVDLRTGNELWSRNNTRVSFGQLNYWQSFNLYGTYPYLWETDANVPTTWRAYDAYTGEYVYQMINVPSGAQIYGSKGEILRAVVNTQAGWMALFNSTKAGSLEGWTVPQIMQEIKVMSTDQARAEFAYGSWIPFNRIINGADLRSYSWNVTIPRGLPGAVMAILDDRVIGSNVGALVALSPDPIVFWALGIGPNNKGQLLFNVSWPAPSGNLTLTYATASKPEDIFVMRAKDTRSWWAFSTDNGKLLWGPTSSEAQLNIFDAVPAIAEGKFFSMGQSGILYAYDAKSGQLLWNTTIDDPYSEILWSNNWPMRIAFVSDDMIFIGQEEHSGNSPLPRGGPFIAINATTGETVWKMEGALRQNHWGGRAIIGDGIIATADTYDNRIYAIGKGPSSTSITTSAKVSTIGQRVLIEGMVLDVSAGTKSPEVLARFPNGVPAVADQAMSDWMKYVYIQFPRPTNSTGVEVTLSVVDANGNYRDIGKTTTNSDGFFTFGWDPDIEGTYTVYASFAGSESYWPSHAVTSFSLSPASPTPTPTRTSEGNPMDAYLLPGIVAIIITVIVVGVLLALIMVRRRP